MVVAALRGVVPWAAVAGGVASGAAVLPPAKVWHRTANQAFTVVLIFVVTGSVARVVAGLIHTVTQSRPRVAGSATIFVNITRVLILAIGFLVMLQSLGISMAPMLSALGVGGPAVAPALQDPLANLFAGIHILASKTVQPGDYIKLSSGEEGYVEDINWGRTTVRALSNNLIVIPNGQLAKANMTNFKSPKQQLTILVQVGVAYDSDLDQVEKVTMDVVAEVMTEITGAVPDREPAVRFRTFGDNRIIFTVILGVGMWSSSTSSRYQPDRRRRQDQ
jgi:small-conductance mechanosensitive channel